MITPDALKENLSALKERPGRAAKERVKWGLLFITPWLIGIIVFQLIPFLASFGFSLTRFDLIAPETTTFVGVENWNRALLDDPKIYDSFGVTFLFASISLPITMGFALMLALMLNSSRVRGKALFRTLFYMPMVIPLVATALIWAGVFNENAGWINLLLKNVLGINDGVVGGLQWLTDPTLIYITLTFIGLWGVGNTMLITLSGLENVPTDLYEAAEIDGANYWQKLIYITAPMISPVLFYNLIMGIIGLMQYFLVPFVLNEGQRFPNETVEFIAVYFFNQSFKFFNMSYGATIGWLIFFVSLALTYILFGNTGKWVHYAGQE